MLETTNVYGFEPIKALAIVAAVLFAITAIVHLVQMIMYKTWYFLAFTIGAFMMTTGYIFRYFSAEYPTSTALYAGQNLFIILPPTLFAATLYLIYTRIAVLVNEPRASIVRPDMVTRVFVCADVVSFLTQCGGGGIMSVRSMAVVGQNLTIFGLGLQIASFGLFVFVTVMFAFRMKGATTIASQTKYGRWTWRRLLGVLFAASLLIMVRCVYRVVEFSGVGHGYLIKHEAFTYVFDCAPMFVVCAMLNVVHAGQTLPQPDSGVEVHEEYAKLTDKVTDKGRVGGKGRVISFLR